MGFSHRLVSWHAKSIIGLVLAIVSAPAYGQGYYLFGKAKTKIPLGTSKEFIAVALTKAEADNFRNQFLTQKSQERPRVTLLLGNILFARREDFGAIQLYSDRVHAKDRFIAVYTFGRIVLIPSDQILVHFQPRTPDVTIRRLLAGYERESIGEMKYLLHIPNAAALEVANSIARDAAVQYAEPNFTTLIPAPPPIPPVPIPTMGASPSQRVPNDVYFSQQWFLQNQGVGNPRVDIRVQQAWKITKGEGVTVAVLDLGVDMKHPDIAAKIVSPYDAINSNDDPTPASADDYHGTACAGLVAATTNNIAGIAGVGWNTKIMPVRMATYDRLSQSWQTNPRIIGRAIDTAVDRGADVLSSSWSTAPSNEVDAAIDRALAIGRNKKGAILVFAVGNANGSVEWPANTSLQRPLAAVSATNEWDEFKTPASQDNEAYWGSNSGPEVTVSAPGVHLFTTNLKGGSTANAGDYIPNFHGTSASTPIVAGVVALIASVHRSATAKEIIDTLEQRSDDLGPAGRDNQFGYGRVNACKAVGASGC